MPLLATSIGVGLVVSLLFSELFGLAVGGMVVPGYVALFLNRPRDVALTLGAGFVTFLLVRGMAVAVIIYGRRRTVLMILTGYLLGVLIRAMPDSLMGDMNTDAQVIGYIIPGLIGIWMDRQGVIETVTALLSGAVVVRLILILFLGTEVMT